MKNNIWVLDRLQIQEQHAFILEKKFKPPKKSRTAEPQFLTKIQNKWALAKYTWFF